MVFYLSRGRKTLLLDVVQSGNLLSIEKLGSEENWHGHVF